MIRALWTVAVAASLVGCFASPSPLSPNLSGTIGLPHLGVQTAGVELPRQGEGFVRFRPNGQHHFGLPRLVTGVTAAAARVAALLPGGAPLVIGDLSARGGGKIHGHASHRTGRDVDLLLYVTTPGGVPVRSPGFIVLGADGLGYVPETSEYVRIDVPREWQLIKALLLDPELGVQFMFLSRELTALVIDYAIARDEPAAVIYHAESVLFQPSDALPHDDHLHLRIACQPAERVDGCDGGGPYWPWLAPLPSPLAIDDGLLTEIAHDDPLIEPAPIAHTSAELPGGA